MISEFRKSKHLKQWTSEKRIVIWYWLLFSSFEINILDNKTINEHNQHMSNTIGTHCFEYSSWIRAPYWIHYTKLGNYALFLTIETFFDLMVLWARSILYMLFYDGINLCVYVCYQCFKMIYIYLLKWYTNIYFQRWIFFIALLHIYKKYRA